jgi:hypothetical protein
VRRLVFALVIGSILFVGAAFFARGPMLPDYVVFIQLPEIVQAAAAEVGATVTGHQAADPRSVPIQWSLKAKLALKGGFSAIGLGQGADEYAETYAVRKTGTNTSLECTFRGRGDQVIGITLHQGGDESTFLTGFNAALQKQLPTYAISIVPPNKSLERTHER